MSDTKLETANEHFIVVGKLSGVFGTRGWFKVFSYTRPRGNLFDFSDWFFVHKGARERRRLLDAKEQGNRLIAKLEGIDDRDVAALWLNKNIEVPRSALPKAEGDEIYWADMIGLDVINRDGAVLGKVQRLLETGAHDVLEVLGDRERLIPFVRERFIDEVDLQTGKIIVDWHVDD